jgi:uncharacterized protein (DUF488 family)
MTTQIFTAGYGQRQPSEIAELLDELGAVLVDIRFNPYGRPGFKGWELTRHFAGRYLHVKALGNADYKTGGMRIADYETGKAALARLDRPALLLCACASPLGCHRTVVGDMLRCDGFTVAEAQFRRAPAPAPTPQQPKPQPKPQQPAANQPSLWGDDETEALQHRRSR